MRENDGRKLDHQTLEALRLRAVERVEQGADPREVALALGLHKHTVYGWVATARNEGREALRAKPIPGRPSKLTQAQSQRVYEVGVRKLFFGLESGSQATLDHMDKGIRVEYAQTVLRNYRGEPYTYPEPREKDCSVPYDEIYYAGASSPPPRLPVLRRNSG